MSFRISAVILCLLTTSAGVATASLAAESAGLTGEWVLDAGRSDDPVKKVKEMRPGGSWFRPGPPGDFGGPDDGPGPDNEPRRPRAMTGYAALDDALLRSERMAIGQREGRYSISYAAGKVREIHAPGDVREVSASGKSSDGEFGFSIAYWDGNTLVIETPYVQARPTLERYTLVEGGKALRLEISLHRPMAEKPLTIRRLFRRSSTTSTAP